VDPVPFIVPAPTILQSKSHCLPEPYRRGRTAS